MLVLPGQTQRYPPTWAARESDPTENVTATLALMRDASTDGAKG